MTDSAAQTPTATGVNMDEILGAVAWALYKQRHPLFAAKAWEQVGEGEQVEFLGLARVAVAAMVETGWGDNTSLIVTTFDELDAAPKGYIAVDHDLLTFTKPFHADNIWLLTGFDRHFSATDISLPARLIPPILPGR
jgi:hypothetical protein